MPMYYVNFQNRLGITVIETSNLPPFEIRGILSIHHDYVERNNAEITFE